MPHIFISYSHTDIEYVRKLATHLHEEGFETWVDMRLDYGSHWPVEIQQRLDSCDAFILIMSPRSFTSEWVQSELSRAKRKQKPIFPMLLEGDEPWLSVESTQYFDIRDGGLPDKKFYTALERVMSRSTPPITASFSKPVKIKPAVPPYVPPPAVQTTARPRYAGFILGVLLCGFAALGAILIPVIWAALSPNPTSVPTPNRVTLVSETPLPSRPIIVPPTATLESTAVLPTATLEPTSLIPTATLVPRPRIYGFQSCPIACDGHNSTTSFSAGSTKIFFQFNYENFEPGIPYMRTWSMNGREWIRYTCNWDGPSSGTEPLKLTEPGGLADGTWVLRVTVNNETLLQEEIVLVGNHNYWAPAGTINACHGTN
jgi:hypothetical protein